MRLAVLACLLTGCASTELQLDRIEPARVSSMVATRAVVTGRLAADAHVDLDSDGAGIDRGWRLRVGTEELADVAWRDRSTIDVVIPRGLGAGVYDVTAISPSGDRLGIENALTVTDDPIGLVLSIESAADGSGSAVSAEVAAGETITAYAIVRDHDGAFVANVATDWQLSAQIGAVTSTGPSATVMATTVGTATLHAHERGAALDADSGPLGVHAGVATQLRIVDTSGAPIGAVTGLTTDADHGLVARAASYDAFGNFAGDTAAIWTTNGVAATVSMSNTTATIDFTTPGTGTLSATHATLGSASTGALVVAPGRAAALAVTPSTMTISADAAPLALAVAATDADGNATTDLGVVTWSVMSGGISVLSASGILDPTAAGTGTIAATSSFGPSATGTITITPGAPAAIAVSPPTLVINADAPAMQFTATVTDADGNTTTQAPTWAASGIATLASDGTLDPTTAGTGTVTASSGFATANASVTILPGRARTLVVTPSSADIPEGDAPVPFSVTGTDQDGNATADLGALTWSVATGTIATLDASGVLSPEVPGTGRVRATSAYGVFGETQTITIRRRAALAAAMTLAGPLSVGGRATASLAVTNTGEVAALGVTPCSLATSTGLVVAGTPAPLSSLAPGATAMFTWAVDATTPGTQQVTGCATATDAAIGTPVTSANATASIAVQRPAVLVASVSLPAVVGRGTTFAITLDVTNTGEATATSVVPALSSAGPSLMLVSTSGSASSLAGGASTTITSMYRASAVGVLQVTATATGIDAGSGATITSDSASATSDVVEAVTVGVDPLGDGSTFGFVTGYRGTIVIGPNRTGSTVASFSPSGAPLGVQTFLFARDAVGSTHENTAQPYRTLGATGCVANTLACGPDNENGRGTLAAVTFGGAEWLVAQSARDSKGSDYAYMTSDTDANLDFAYVDLRSQTPGETFGSSAIAAVGNRLYIGEFGKGNAGPVLLALGTTPSLPGLDATGSDLVDLKVSNIAALDPTVTTHEKIDTFGAFGGLLYLANPGAWVRATIATPRPYSSNPTDWLVITPSAPAYAAKVSRTTTKLVDLFPADRGVPQMASFGGRVFVGRNTTTGPQLWSCDPAATGVVTQCESADWQLIARNASGDTQLSQFDTNLTSVSMVVATAEYLYVGFDSPSGVRVMRTANPAASAQSDFERDYGGAGLGAPANTRILDGKALTVGGTTAVWITVAGTGPLTLVKLP